MDKQNPGRITIQFFVVLCLCSLFWGCGKKTPTTENLRPQAHFSASKNWINDPNGLVFIDGEYHLFYQYNPFGNTWGHMSWGHAVSRDLYSWRELPVAMKESGPFFYPTMKFSGSAVLDVQNTSGLCDKRADCIVAAYTQWTLLRQKQNIAVSHDRGLTFSEYGDNPVLDENSWSFRDPKVFRFEKSSKWIMVVARPSVRRIAFYESTNLKQWRHLSDFSTASDEGIWECPDLFYLPEVGNPQKGKWILLVSVAETKRGSFTQYFVGNFDGTNFVPESSQPQASTLDHGFDFYAAVSWENLSPDNRTIIGWMNNWEYADSLPTHPWKGSMSLPRRLALVTRGNRYFLQQTPRDEIRRYRTHSQTERDIFLKDQTQTVALKTDSADVSVVFTDITAREVGIRLKAGSGEAATINYHSQKKLLAFDRGGLLASLPQAQRFAVSTVSIPEQPVALDMRIIIDKSTIEIFLLQGTTVFSNLAFPDNRFSSLEIYAAQGGALAQDIVLHSIGKK